MLDEEMLALNDFIFKTTINSRKLKRDMTFYLDRYSFIWIDEYDLGYGLLSDSCKYHRISIGGSFSSGKPIICNYKSICGFNRTCYRWLHQFYKKPPVE